MSRDQLRRTEWRRALEPIVAYVGSNGSGKTLCAVRDSILAAEQRGARILSNLVIDHEAYVPLRSWDQLLGATNCEILLDEVSGVASARQHATLPPQLENELQQLRKSNARLRWTSPNYARADVILREVTRMVVACRGSLGRRGEDSAWPEHRVFRWWAYDAQAFEQFTLQMVDELRPVSRRIYRRRDGDRFAMAYDSGERVPTMAHIAATGICLNCGGRRQPNKCKCPQHDDRPTAVTADLSVSSDDAAELDSLYRLATSR